MGYKWTLQEFTEVTKVIRMLYGVSAATLFFETNFEAMTDIALKDLNSLVDRAKVKPTLENTTER